MTWKAINPGEIAYRMDADNPVSSRQGVVKATNGMRAGVWRDGTWWGDERLWHGSGPDRPFLLSPLLPEDFKLGDPVEMMGEAERCLAAGKWKRGWQLYEMRHQIEQGRSQMRRLFMRHWDGGATRRLLVHAGQGAGDAIMFSRYLDELDERGFHFDFLVEPSLFRLMSNQYPGRVVAEVNEHLYEHHVPLESLPLALEMYEPMQLMPTIVTKIPVSRRKQRRVGICWAGQPSHPRNVQRSMTLEQVMNHVPKGSQVISVQMGEAKQQLQFATGITDASPYLRDWEDTAEVLRDLDMLVTVDTGVAHLAGALGLPVKLIVREPVEWRWGKQGRTTPWYDSLEIVRC